MQLTRLRMRYFKTIGQAYVELPLDRYMTIVGPNNSGKTNILHAIQLLFTGNHGRVEYCRDRDFTFGGGTAKTSLLATFSADPTDSRDREFLEQLARLYSLYQLEPIETTFSLSLVMSPSDKPIYQFLPNTKRPDNKSTQSSISRLQKQLVTDLLDRFSCHYVPSEKSIKELYDEVLSPYLKRRAAEVLGSKLGDLETSLEQVSNQITSELAVVGLEDLVVSFNIPDNDLISMLNRFEFRMKDPSDTAIGFKGQGIQSTAFFAALRWVSEQEKERGLRSVWLLEEPEAYLHPSLMDTVHELLQRLSAISTVVVSTHALAFVPKDPRDVVGTQRVAGATELVKFETYTEATNSIRNSLGVHVSDFFGLGYYNLGVEGKSDRELISWYLSVAPKEEAPLLMLRKAKILDFGGVRALGGWMRAVYSYVRRERAFVAVFDGDQAGERERRDLSSYFGQHDIPFNSNEHFVMVRAGRSIEGLFPDEWIDEIHAVRPEWFDDYNVDSMGQLVSYHIKKGSAKTRVQHALMSRVKAEVGASWRSQWDIFARCLDLALVGEGARLARESVDELE